MKSLAGKLLEEYNALNESLSDRIKRNGDIIEYDDYYEGKHRFKILNPEIDDDGGRNDVISYAECIDDGFDDLMVEIVWDIDPEDCENLLMTVKDTLNWRIAEVEFVGG